MSLGFSGGSRLQQMEIVRRRELQGNNNTTTAIKKPAAASRNSNIIGNGGAAADASGITTARVTTTTPTAASVATSSIPPSAADIAASLKQEALRKAVNLDYNMTTTTSIVDSVVSSPAVESPPPPAPQNNSNMGKLQDYKQRLLDRQQKRLAQQQQAQILTQIQTSSQSIEAGGNVPAPAILPVLLNSHPKLPAVSADKAATAAAAFPAATAAPPAPPPLSKQEVVTATAEVLQSSVNAVAAANEAAIKRLNQKLDEAVKNLELRYHDVTLRQRTESGERAKLDVAHRSTQEELTQLKKATGNPTAFQDEIQRTFKTTEEQLFKLLGDKQNDQDAQINIVLSRMVSLEERVTQYVEEAMQRYYNSFFWAYAEVVAGDGGEEEEGEEQPPTTQSLLHVYNQDFTAAAATNEGGDNSTGSSSRKVITSHPIGAKIYVCHPMRKDEATGDIWMQTKHVDTKGTVVFGHIMVYSGARKKRLLHNFAT